jgi:hypothetical protein
MCFICGFVSKHPGRENNKKMRLCRLFVTSLFFLPTKKGPVAGALKISL